MKRVKITIIAELDKDLIEVKKEQGMSDKEIFEQVKRQVKYNSLNDIPLIHDFKVEGVELQ